MKIETNKAEKIRKSLGFISVFAGVGLGLITLTYLSYASNLATVEQEAQLSSTMLKAAQLNVVLMDINRGQVANAKTYITSILKHDAQDISDAVADGSNTKSREFAMQLVTRITANEQSKKVLASNQHGSFDATTIQVVGH